MDYETGVALLQEEEDDDDDDVEVGIRENGSVLEQELAEVHLDDQPVNEGNEGNEVVDEAEEGKSDEESEEAADFEGIEHRQHLAERAYKQGTQYVSVDILLTDIGMAEYINDFIEADEDMIECFARVEDEEVDQMLRNVEKRSKFVFPYEDRCRIWKGLRYRWFKSPEYAQTFIHRSEVPLLTVPKKDHRLRDNHIDLTLLESDRQKMVIRKAVFDEIEGTSMAQEEIYKREPHLYYDLNGLDKSVHFWMTQDPRKMSREDPREEVLLNWVQEIELGSADIIDKSKLRARIKKLVHRVFLVVRIVFLLFSVLLFSTALIQITTESSPVPSTERLVSKSYLNVSLLYLMTYLFLTEVTKDRKRASVLNNAKKMHAHCRLLFSEMISFRLKTHYLRQLKIPRYLDESTVNSSGSKSTMFSASTVFTGSNRRRAALRGNTQLSSQLSMMKSRSFN